MDELASLRDGIKARNDAIRNLLADHNHETANAARVLIGELDYAGSDAPVVRRLQAGQSWCMDKGINSMTTKKSRRRKSQAEKLADHLASKAWLCYGSNIVANKLYLEIKRDELLRTIRRFYPEDK